MKTKILTVLIAFLLSSTMRADEKSFNEAMTQTLTQMQTAASPEDFNSIANQFERIAKVEQNQWLPYYYASYSSVIQSFMIKDPDKIDQILDYADNMLNEAMKLKSDESENYVLKGFIACARIAVDPNTRGADYSQDAISAIKKAQGLNPENPRADYLMGILTFHMPDFYGGGKAAAKPILEGAMQKYEKFIPLSAIYPMWGKDDCKKQLDQCN
jgi:hypothetical protein